MHQLYTAKLRGRGLVNRGLYALTNHPQYLALGILGLGTLLVWPRFLVLVTYVTVVFLYVVLARLEERRCLVEFGDQYRRYTERSRSRALRQFLTWLPALPAAGIPRAGVVFALYVLALAASVVVGLRLRDYALAHVSAVYMSDAAVLSPAVLSQEELTAAWEVARSAGIVDKIAAEGRGGKLLVYVVPLDWEIPDLPLPLPEKRPRGHYKPLDFDRSRFRVLFATPRSHRHDLEGREIVARSYGLNPEALVQVDLKTRGIIQREEPPPHVFWGDVPTPLF